MTADDRRAAALRDNLHRRKAQARSRRDPATEPEPSVGPPDAAAEPPTEDASGLLGI